MYPYLYVSSPDGATRQIVKCGDEKLMSQRGRNLSSVTHAKGHELGLEQTTGETGWQGGDV